MDKDLEYLHFDSINSTYNNLDCYDTTYYLNDSLRNINRIYLKSIELPIGFNNIRFNNGSSILTLIINSISYTKTISDYMSTSINDLCAALTTAFNTLPIIPTFTASLTTQKITISLASSTTIIITGGVLAQNILGFTSGQTISGLSIVSTNNFNLAIDNFISLFIMNVPYKTTSSQTQLISFKVPLNAIGNTVYYMADNMSFSQYITISDPNFVLTCLRIQIYDRFGKIIKSNGLDYTMTLAIQRFD